MKRLFLGMILILLLTGCQNQPAQPLETPSDVPTPLPASTPTFAQNEAAPAPESAPTAFTLTSPVFAAGEAIPAQYTCTGKDISPALEWSAPPAGTQSLALIMDDPDAPGGTWVHWVVYNLPPDSTGLAEGASEANGTVFDLPAGALQGKTSFRRSDYGGPCPPSGTHHYNFRLYALDSSIDQPDLDKPGLIKAMEGHILAQTELIGTYTKP
jgi:Raf kinase inhibitor-like YbhB/YbcL family protein